MDRTFQVILKPLRRFAIMKPNASLLLFMATIIAMVLANSPLASSYHQLLAFPIDLQAGKFNFFSHHGEPMSMLAFVNDALMAVFFFVIGLEIKQEEADRRVELIPQGVAAHHCSLWWNDRPGDLLHAGMSRTACIGRSRHSDGNRHCLCIGCAGSAG